MKTQWIVQLALPWMVNDPEEPKKEEKRRKIVPKWMKPCALALAEINLQELGAEAKARIYNPTTGEYEAMLYTVEDEKVGERIQTFHGKDRDKAA